MRLKRLQSTKDGRYSMINLDKMQQSIKVSGKHRNILDLRKHNMSVPKIMVGTQKFI